MIYADTSVLSSLILRDSNSSRSLVLVEQTREPLAFNGLLRLEVENSIRLCVAGGRMTEQEASRSQIQVEDLQRKRWWESVEPDWERVYERAVGLSRAHTAQMNARSLDILHVACAMELGLRTFWSFDKKQRRLAELTGLKINPLEE